MANDQYDQAAPMSCPAFFHLSGRLAVVVGGGPVGCRRAQAVLAGGGRVRLVCLEAKPLEAAFAPIEWRMESYQNVHLQSAFLVFAAATPKVNRQVLRDARAGGQLVNVADEPAASDFLMPATIRRGPLTIAVTTSVPTVTRQVRRVLEEACDDAMAAWIETLAELRPLIRQQLPDPVRRRQVLRCLAERSWLERFRQVGAEEARRLLYAETLRLVSAEPRPL